MRFNNIMCALVREHEGVESLKKTSFMNTTMNSEEGIETELKLRTQVGIKNEVQLSKVSFQYYSYLLPTYTLNTMNYEYEGGMNEYEC